MPRTEEANQQIREQRRLQILVTAAKVFARKGLSDTRIADIAAECEMSQGLIYRYFSSKEEVFAEMLQGYTAFMLELCAAAQSQPGTAFQKLEWLTQQILPYLYDQPEGALVIMHALINEGVPAEVREAVRVYSEKLQGFVRGLIVEAQADGQVVEGQPEKLATLYLATLQGLSAAAGFLGGTVKAFPDANTILRCLQK